MQPLPVFVVSLARAAARRADIAQHLADLGIDFIMTDAVDGKLLPPEEHARLLAPGVTYANPGVVGCYMSHMNIYQRMVDETIPAAIILEDDAALKPGIVPLIRQGLATTDFDYAFLDCDHDGGDGPVFYDPDDRLVLGGGLTAYRLSSGPMATHAQIVSLAAARKRLTHGLPIHEPVDRYAHLPYAPSFYAVLHPRVAGVSDMSLQSMTSEREEVRKPFLAGLRHTSVFPLVRDWLKLRPLKSWLAARARMASGALPAGKRWRGLPMGREVIRFVGQ